ncbi:MAG: hypothetical protein LH679_01060 [Cyanobacteria bacterium CAN_BIN43]|nr:hypothetical protein [Cyanobacteria bacterium CAN_BIN43]
MKPLSFGAAIALADFNPMQSKLSRMAAPHLELSSAPMVSTLLQPMAMARFTFGIKSKANFPIAPR